MKISNLTGIILLFSITICLLCVFIFSYKTIENKMSTALTLASEAPVLTQKLFDPASLNWKQEVATAPWQDRDSLAVVVYKNKLWLMAGLNANNSTIAPGNINYEKAEYFSDVWSSEDGINWIKIVDNSPWQNRRSIQIVDFKDKMWLMGGWGPQVGYKNDIWSSEDGVNWIMEKESAEWPAREGHSLFVFNNKLWLIGGVRYDKQLLFNDVWSSEDGINWTEVSKVSAWAPRWDHSVVVFKNKLWLMGGMIFGGQMFNDIWSSEDGINWTQITAQAPFETRQGFFATEYRDRIWVIGRLDAEGNGGINDVWYSSDAINWQKTSNDPLWLGREDFGAAIFKDNIWIFGGMDKNWTWTNDIWHSTYDTINL